MVQQTPRHFSSMSVHENVALGALFGRAGAHRKEEQALELAVEALSFVGLAERRQDPVGNLNLHEQRFLELARAIAGQPRLLVLDEVMAGLNDAELEASIKIIRTIRDQLNMTIIWVEHVMKAVISLAERTLVLNFGNVLTEGLPKDVMRHPAVVEAYLGRRSNMLEVQGLSAGYQGNDVVYNVTFHVAAGEAVMIIGSNGAGKTTLFRAICGLLSPSTGRVLFEGDDITGMPAERIARLGMRFVAAERHLFPRMTVRENLLLGAYPHRPDPATTGERSESIPPSRRAAAATRRNDERRRATDARRGARVDVKPSPSGS